MEISLTDCIILTHAYVEPEQKYKLEPIEFAAKHARQNNPHSYIILAGHGLKPDIDNGVCDYIHWEDQINDKDINVGHPRLCNIAYDHAEYKGFEKILKTRADSIHLIENITAHCDRLLGNKKLLVTQQTAIDRPQIGDLFMYGDLQFIKKCWNIDTWYPTKTGITSLAKNFLSTVDKQIECEQDWHDACIDNLSFVDIYNLKWICLQKNWNEVSQNSNSVMKNIMSDWHNHLWGSKQKWHTWDAQGNLIYSKPKVGTITTEKDWK